MPDINLGKVSAQVGLDISELDANEQKAALRMRQLADAQEKLVQKSKTQMQEIEKLGSAIDALKTARDKAAFSDTSAFLGIDDEKIKKILEQLEQLDREYDNLKKKQSQQIAEVERLEKLLNAATGRNKIKEIESELAKANKELEATEKQLKKVAEKTEPLKGKLFDEADQSIAKREKDLEALQAEYERTGTEIDVARQKQELFDSQLAQKSARSEMTMSIGAITSGLRTMGVVSSDLSGTVGQVVMQLTNMKRAIAAAQAAGAGTMATVSAVTAGLGIAVAVIAKVVEAYKEAKQKQREYFDDAISYIGEYKSKLETIERAAKVLNDETSTVDELTTARQTLESTFDGMIAGYDAEGNALYLSNEALQEQIKLLQQKYDLNLKIAASDTTALEDYLSKEKELENLEKRLQQYREDYEYSKSHIGKDQSGELNVGVAKRQMEETEAEIDQIQSELMEMGDKVFAYYSAKVEQDVVGRLGSNLNSAQHAILNNLLAEHQEFFSSGKIDLDDYNNMIDDAILPALENWEDSIRDLREHSDNTVSALSEGAKNYAANISALKTAQQELNESHKFSASTLQSLIAAYPALEGKIALYQSGLLSEKELLKELAQEQKNEQDAYEASVRAKLEATDDFYKKIKDNAVIKELVSQYQSDGKAFATVQELKIAVSSSAYADINKITTEMFRANADKYGVDLKNYKNLTEAKIELAKRMSRAESGFVNTHGETVFENYTYQGLEKELRDLQKRNGDGKYDALISDIQTWIADQDKAFGAISDIDKIVEQYSSQIKGLQDKVDSSTGSARDKVYDAYKEELDQINYLKNIGQLTTEQELAALEELLAKYKSNAEARKELEVDIYNLKKQIFDQTYNAEKQHIEDLKALGQINGQQEIEMYDKLLAKYKENTDIKMELEKKLYALKEQNSTSEYNEERKLVNHRKNTGQLTTEQEIAELERLLAKYRSNADIRMQLEEDIYALKQSLIRGESAAVGSQTQSYVNETFNAVKAALTAKYKAQAEAEKKAIQQSIDNWKTWEKETTASIQAQIDELDRLNDAQEYESKVSEYNQKLQAIDLKLQFEKDSYNLGQLQKERARIQDELNDVIADKELNDKRASLRAEMDAIKEKSAAEQEILQEQLKATEEKYSAMTETVKLNQEAQKILISKGQQDIVNLIKSYAPDYFKSGEAVGEQFVYGLNMSLEGVETYFETIRSMVLEQQTKIAATMSGAASDYFNTKEKYEARIASNSSTVNNTSNSADNRSFNFTINSADNLSDPIAFHRLCERIQNAILRSL